MNKFVSNINSIIDFTGDMRQSAIAKEVMESAKQSILDWFSVCIAARTDNQAMTIMEMVRGWKSTGHALGLDGSTGAASPIALLNGTLSHTLDFDDFHMNSVMHATGPIFSSVFSLGLDRDKTGMEIITAFISGYEVGTNFGLNDVGMSLVKNGWHTTSILGHISSAVSCAALLKLDPLGLKHAIGFSAVQSGGLIASSGTISKALLVGKAAMSGVMAAELAEKGGIAPIHLLDSDDSGFLTTFMKNEEKPRLVDLGHTWQIFNNAFKPYPACQLTHAAYDSAKSMREKIDVNFLRKIRAFVNPFALDIAKYRDPKSALEARFSINFCIALGLLGYDAGLEDFSEIRIEDKRVQALLGSVDMIGDESINRWSARIEVELQNGEVIYQPIIAALGSHDRPMNWSDLELKFIAICEPIFGSREANNLLNALRNFEKTGALQEVVSIMAQ